mmetsp:Transcript_6076/g.17027  ORF Transcript_6076/g.17027 Transcript_6076/m.17027 type:complete len:189 (-) Transcript_6076:10-576(-)
MPHFKKATLTRWQRLLVSHIEICRDRRWSTIQIFPLYLILCCPVAFPSAVRFALIPATLALITPPNCFVKEEANHAPMDKPFMPRQTVSNLHVKHDYLITCSMLARWTPAASVVPYVTPVQETWASDEPSFAKYGMIRVQKPVRNDNPLVILGLEHCSNPGSTKLRRLRQENEQSITVPVRDDCHVMM